MATIIGQCLTERDLQKFYYDHTKYGDNLFRMGHSGIPEDLRSLFLPGQFNLPLRCMEFHDYHLALAAVQISHEWGGNNWVEHWRVLYVDPRVEALFLQEMGPHFLDIPLGDNERFVQEEDDDEEDEADQTIVLDDDLRALLIVQSAQQGIDLNTLANAAIRAASKMFSDCGLKYSLNS